MLTTSMTYTDILAHFRTVRSDQIATIYARLNPVVETLGVRFGHGEADQEGHSACH